MGAYTVSVLQKARQGQSQGDGTLESRHGDEHDRANQVVEIFHRWLQKVVYTEAAPRIERTDSLLYSGPTRY